MKYILIVGKKDAGKSTTISNVCERLKPTKIQRLIIYENSIHSGYRCEDVDQVDEIFNGTYILEVNGKVILIVVGSPTEQKRSITILIEITIKIKIRIDFALIAVRTSERLEGFNTWDELKKYGSLILDEWIEKIKDEKFNETDLWKSRIEKITSLVNSSIL